MFNCNLSQIQSLRKAGGPSKLTLEIEIAVIKYIFENPKLNLYQSLFYQDTFLLLHLRKLNSYCNGILTE